MRKSIYGFIVVLLCSLSFAGAAEKISIAEVNAAQKEWGEAIVAIGKSYTQKQDYKALAQQLVRKLYAYDIGTVLFKPTKAAAVPFRPTLEEAVSYFVTGVVPEDHGFALAPWSKVRFAEVKTIPGEGWAISMGHYYFTDANTGKEVKVEFTFAYVKDDQGNLRIVTHHSSLPYSPPVK